MSSINTNLSAMTALQSLKTTQSSLNKTQGQISTGLRVGEASHNASYWSIATKMKSDNGALGAVKDSISQSKAMIDTYTSGISKSLDYLNKMKDKLTAGSNPGADLEAIQVELKGSIEGLKSAAASATFNGQNWLTGDAKTVKLVTSYDGESKSVNMLSVDTTKIQLFDDASNPTTGLLKAVAATDITSPPNVGGHSDIDLSGMVADDIVYISVNGGAEEAVAFNTDVATTLTDIAAETGIDTAVDLGTGGSKVRITGDQGSNVSVRFAKVTTAAATELTAANLTENNKLKMSSGDVITFEDGGGTPREFKISSEKNVDDLVAAINADASLKKVVVASKSATGGLVMTGIGGAVTDLKYENSTRGAETTYGQIAVANALVNVDRAINDLRSGSAMLGANKALLETQEEFIGVLSDSLTAGVSAFVDADMNETSTRLQALQTQQQLGVQALSIANQNSQMILRLFQ